MWEAAVLFAINRWSVKIHVQIAGKCIRDRMNYIVFEKVEYPVREIWINEYKNVMRISSEDLNDVLLDSTGNYKTREAKW